MTACKCGRETLHCPFCGCGTVYGRSTLTRVVDGVEVFSYRCRKCSKLFDDLSRELCSSPLLASRYNKPIETKIDKEIEKMSMSERLAFAHKKLRHIQGVGVATKHNKEPTASIANIITEGNEFERELEASQLKTEGGES